MILTLLQMKSPPVRTGELVQALRLLMRGARAEKGFINCRLGVGVQDANLIWYEERWERGEDVEEQVRSSRFTRLLALMETAAEQPTLEFHFVSETRGLDYIAA